MAIQRSGRFGRIKKPLKSDMNVVPYIDVMLVLLVIFMVTAPMISSSLKVDLPKAKSSPFQSKDTPAIVTLDASGNYLLRYHEHKDEEMSLDELKQTLSEAQQHAQDNQQELSVLINGTQSRPYGEVVVLMANLQDAGLTQVGLLTDPAK